MQVLLNASDADLAAVDVVVGEYHPLRDDDAARLEARLTAAGFETCIEPPDGARGRFWARRSAAVSVRSVA